MLCYVMECMYVWYVRTYACMHACMHSACMCSNINIIYIYIAHKHYRLYIAHIVPVMYTVHLNNWWYHMYIYNICVCMSGSFSKPCWRCAGSSIAMPGVRTRCQYLHKEKHILCSVAVSSGVQFLSGTQF